MALATTMRSPKSCDSSFRYGVSPQPAHAPGNSKSGSSSCVPRTVEKSTCPRSVTGSDSKKRMRSRAGSGSSSRVRHVDGAAPAHRRVLHRADLDAEAAARAVLLVDLQRVARVGEAARVDGRGGKAVRRAVERPRSSRPSRESPRAGTRTSSCRTGCRAPASHSGTLAEMPRFSHFAVPLGNVPSTGNALTGSSSPRPSSIAATTSLHERRRAGGDNRQHPPAAGGLRGAPSPRRAPPASGPRPRSSSARPPCPSSCRSSRWTP